MFNVVERSSCWEVEGSDPYEKIVANLAGREELAISPVPLTVPLTQSELRTPPPIFKGPDEQG